MANKESTFGNAISLRQYLNEQLSSDNGYSDFMKITNINNINAVPCDVDENEGTVADADDTSVKFGLGDYIHDAQLVWVGDRFYLQGKKIYIIEETIDNESVDIEKFSPTYLFPFDAIAVTFENRPSDNTIIFDVNDQEGSKATITTTSKTVEKGSAYGDLPTPTRASSSTYSFEFKGWFTTKKEDSTSDPVGTSIASTDINYNINGQVFYAAWKKTALSQS